MKPCEVSWCVSFQKPGSRYCAVHASRPVERNEDQNQWLIRLRAEDKAAEKKAAQEAEQKAYQEAMKR